ncbi:MAG: MBL fold metallo-hydrolase, partial [Firmicutes bacterium]|nr:MBL fold metallo-hydrolase [Bacillota bacterium]
NSTVYTGEIDGEYINFEVGSLYWSMLEDLFATHGFPKATDGRKNTDFHPGRQYSLDKRVDFTYISDGDVLEYGGYRLRAFMTPGHTPGHMCLYDEENRRLFSGDHILGTITPNITLELGVENPLGDYLESLARTDKLKVDHIMNTHGTHVDNMHERIAELYEHHTARAAEVVKLLGNDWKHAYDVAADMTWEIDCRNWDEFPVAQKWFATGETVSHLQYLMYEGKVIREERSGVWYYRNK